jgi:predicted RNA-binding Zn ribbon-like protein
VAFTHDTALALQAAVALVNSAEPPDTLTSVAELDTFYDGFHYSGRHDEDQAELTAVRGLRPRLRALLTAGRDEAVEIANALLREEHALPQLMRHDGFDWHVHAVGLDAPLDRRIAVETAMAMLDVIRADEMSRLSTCAQDDCESVVLDLSRNRSKIFCGTACSNRAAVAAYRARRRD